MRIVAICLLFAATTAQARVADEQVARTAADKVVITWTDTAPVDVYASEKADAPLNESRLVSHNNRKGRLETAADHRLYFLLADTKDGTRVRVAERVLPLEHGSNFRDLGGYPAADGKRVRWGMVFRSAGTPLLTEADLRQVDALGLKNLVDLRSSDERQLAPTKINGVPYTAVGYAMQRLLPSSANGRPDMAVLYKGLPTLLVPQLKVLFRELLTGDAPVAFNCSAGQDRTGWTAAVILGALGVPKDMIVIDYHLSTKLRRPEYETPPINAEAFPDNPMAARMSQMRGPRAAEPLYSADHRTLLEYALDEVNTKWGSVEGYLDKEIGVSAVDIAKLRQLYLE